MRLSPWLAAAVAVAALAPPASAASLDLSPASPAVGQYVLVKATVSSKPGSEIFEPSIYVDWDGAACPAGAAEARTAAKGHFRRGMGFAVPPDNFSGRDTEPVSAVVLIEQANQRICIYDAAGALSDSAVVTGTPRFPPQGAKGPVSRWRLTGGRNTSRRGYAMTVSLKGFAADKRLPHALTFGCDTKRFFLNAAKLHIDAGGHFSYNASVTADNSNNYDAPIPLKFGGRAKLNVTGTIAIGQQELKLPISTRNEKSGLMPKGRWGKPVIKLKGTFSAPGYRARPNTKPCSGAVNFLLNPSVDEEDDPAGVMPGQGSAGMATDPKHPNQTSADEAGQGEPVPSY